MSKIFLGVTFCVAGVLLLLLEMTTRSTADLTALHMSVGALLGSGGVLVVWYLSDHLVMGRKTQLPGK